MALGFYARRNPYINPLADLTEQNELAGQNLARRSNVGSNKAPTKAHTPSEAPILPLVPPPTENLFTKFIKVFIEIIQAWDQK